MQLSQTLYTFSVLQYRHDAWIGEALNVGVLLSAPEQGFLRMRGRTASPRLTQAYPDLGASGFRQLIRAIEAKVTSIGQKMEQGSLFDSKLTSDSVARKLLPEDDSSLRWLKPGAGMTSSPKDELDRLFTRYVSRWDADTGRESRSDEDVYSVFQQKLRAAPVDLMLEEKIVKTPRFGEVRFRHAYQNGRLHVVQPISLDMANADTLFGKASRLVGTLTRLRENPEVCPYIVAGAPRKNELRREYVGALDLLREANVAEAIVDEDESQIVADALIAAASRVH